MSRVKNSVKNAKYGMVYQVMYLVLNFVVRISIVNCLGITALSLNGLFTEILSILSLAEMGVGMAITYNLYKPLAEKDEEKIAQLMKLFKKAYWGITTTMFVGGMCLMPFLQYLVKEVDVSSSYLRLVYFLFLVQTCASYLFSYKALLLVADQKASVQAKINIVVRLAFFATSLLSIVVLKNFVCYLVSEAMYAFWFYFVVGKYVDKHYSYINKYESQLPKEETKEILTSVKQVFVGKLSNKVLNSTDNILISVLVGTNLVGVYSTYSMFTNGFLRLFSQVNEAIVGSVGNLIAVETAKKVKEKYEDLTYLFFVLGSVSSVCLYVAVNPFLKAFIGTKYLLPDAVLLTVVVNLFVETLKMPLWTFFNAAGMFKEDQNISLIGCILNVITSIILGKYLGMLGIFIGTLVSLMLMVVLKLDSMSKKLFESSEKGVIAKLFIYILVFGLQLFITVSLCNFINVSSTLLEFLLKGATGLCICLLLSVAPFMKTHEFLYIKNLAKHGANRTVS